MPAPDPATRPRILDGATAVLRRDGLGDLSIRKVASEAGVPVSQVHYHFGSRQGLLLAVLTRENDRLVSRQAAMYEGDDPLSVQWSRACDYYDDDLASGYVRVLHEMMAAGWSDPVVAEAVREIVGAWHGLLRGVAERAGSALGSLGPMSPSEIATLVTSTWLGAEALDLLGFRPDGPDIRSVLRGVGDALRDLESARVG